MPIMETISWIYYVTVKNAECLASYALLIAHMNYTSLGCISAYIFHFYLDRLFKMQDILLMNLE